VRIRKACEIHAELLRQQYELYVPDLVIFCGDLVADCFCEYLYPECGTKWEKVDGKKAGQISYFRLGGGRRFALSWWHPQQRSSPQLDIIVELHHTLCSLYSS
jgi:hypothetical protein